MSSATPAFGNSSGSGSGSGNGGGGDDRRYPGREGKGGDNGDGWNGKSREGGGNGKDASTPSKTGCQGEGNDSRSSSGDIAEDVSNAMGNGIGINERAGGVGGAIDGSSLSPEQESQHRAELERALQNSVRSSAGAYSVVPGGTPMRREVGGSSGPQDEPSTLGDEYSYNHGNSDTAGRSSGVSFPSQMANGMYPYGPNNLPPNIDIIAEATLVEENDIPQNQRQEEEEEDADTLGLDWDERPARGGAHDDSASVAVSVLTSPFPPTVANDPEEENDTDTLGLPWDDGPRPGGALPDSASVAVSAITSHTTAVAGQSRVQSVQRSDLENGDEETTSIRESTADPLPVSEARGDTDEGRVDQVAQTGETVATVQTAQTQPTQLMSTTGESILVHATPVKEGPCAFLGTKSGRTAAFLASILILAVSLGLGLGLGLGNKSNEDENSENDTSPDEEVLTVAQGDFCNSGVPQVFYGLYPSLCSKDELSLGGTFQQGVADAQHHRIPNTSTGQGDFDHVDISLLNAGAVRGEIPAGPVTLEQIQVALPFRDNTVSFLEVTAGDLVKIINNAMNYVAQEIPLEPSFGGAYPYAYGLRYQVDLGATPKAFGFEILVSEEVGWVPLEGTTNSSVANADLLEEKTFMVVTNSWIASGGDGWLEGVVPISIEITDFGFTDALIEYLRTLDNGWVPPTMDDMSTTSFVAP